MFSIEGKNMLSVRRLKDCKTLAYFVFEDRNRILTISQDQIEQTTFEDRTDEKHNNICTKLPIKEFTSENILIFAKFITTEDDCCPEFLVTIDINCRLAVWSVANLLKRFEPTEEDLMVMRVSLVEPDFTINLFKDCRVFDFHRTWIKENVFNELLSDFGNR